MNLFEIEKAIMECVDAETGEIIDVEKLSQLHMDMDAKIENIALWIKNLESDAEALKAEKAVFAERQKACENKADSLKKYLSNYLAGKKFNSTKVSISFRKSESVEADINSLMKLDNSEEFLKYKDPDVDKTAVKKALKAGAVLPGCALIEKQNIQIK